MVNAWQDRTGSWDSQTGAWNDRIIVGAVAADDWIASTGSLPASATVAGVAALDRWEPAPVGTATPIATLPGVLAADRWTAADGALAPGGVVLSGVESDRLWLAVTTALVSSTRVNGAAAVAPWRAGAVGNVWAPADFAPEVRPAAAGLTASGASSGGLTPSPPDAGAGFS